MAGEFSTGDLAILQNAVYHNEFDGTPAVVVGRLAWRNCIDLRTMGQRMLRCYQVRALMDPEDNVFNAEPHQLRRPAGPGAVTTDRKLLTADCPAASTPQRAVADRRPPRRAPRCRR